MLHFWSQRNIPSSTCLSLRRNGYQQKHKSLGHILAYWVFSPKYYLSLCQYERFLFGMCCICTYTAWNMPRVAPWLWWRYHGHARTLTSQRQHWTCVVFSYTLIKFLKCTWWKQTTAKITGAPSPETMFLGQTRRTCDILVTLVFCQCLPFGFCLCVSLPLLQIINIMKEETSVFLKGW